MKFTDDILHLPLYRYPYGSLSLIVASTDPFNKDPLGFKTWRLTDYPLSWKSIDLGSVVVVVFASVVEDLLPLLSLLLSLLLLVVLLVVLLLWLLLLLLLVLVPVLVLVGVGVVVVVVVVVVGGGFGCGGEVVAGCGN